MRNKLAVLYEDEAVIVCIKPAGIPSQGDKKGSLDMVRLLKGHLALSLRKQGKRGEDPYVGVIHRLDRNVRGVMVYAKTKEAAAILSEELRELGFSKIYECIVSEEPKRPLHVGEEYKRIKSYLIPDEKENLMKLGDEEQGGLLSELEYLILSVGEGEAHVRIRLITGRKHQIRVQMTEVSKGIKGDKKYNPLYREQKETGPLSLVCVSLSFTHPVTKERLTFSVPSEVRRNHA